MYSLTYQLHIRFLHFFYPSKKHWLHTIDIVTCREKDHRWWRSVRYFLIHGAIGLYGGAKPTPKTSFTKAFNYFTACAVTRRSRGKKPIVLIWLSILNHLHSLINISNGSMKKRTFISRVCFNILHIFAHPNTFTKLFPKSRIYIEALFKHRFWRKLIESDWRETTQWQNLSNFRFLETCKFSALSLKKPVD